MMHSMDKDDANSINNMNTIIINTNLDQKQAAKRLQKYYDIKKRNDDIAFSLDLTLDQKVESVFYCPYCLTKHIGQLKLDEHIASNELECAHWQMWIYKQTSSSS